MISPNRIKARMAGMSLVGWVVRTNSDALFGTVVILSKGVGAQLMALSEGDSAAITGITHSKVSQSNKSARSALDMVSRGVLTACYPDYK